MTAEKFTGLQYPLVTGPKGLLAKKTGVDQIKADILQLLLTNPGERVMLPTFGTPLRTLMFEQNDVVLEQAARQMIIEAINTWEPRVSITNIEVTSRVNREALHPNDSLDQIDNVLGITIQFIDPENISQVEELRIEKPLGG
jgi:phage baseplate assembly protein W